MGLIYVVAHPRIGNRVAYSERHPDHPLNEYGVHEAYVDGNSGPVQVAEVPEVNRLLAPTTGTLIRVDGELLEAAREKHAQALEQRRVTREAELLRRREQSTEQIGDAETRARELQLKVAELDKQVASRLAVLDAQNQAESQRVRAEAAITTAEADAERVRAANEPTEASGARRSAARSAAAPNDAETTSTPADTGTPAANETPPAGTSDATADAEQHPTRPRR